MLLLVTKAHPTIMRIRHPNLGRLAVPRDHARMAETAAAGIAWAADNAAFSGFDPAAFRRMLARLAGVPGCLFVTCPDVVGDAAATARRFRRWAGLIERGGLPVALAAQDGLERRTVPWGSIDALFIGGTTAWKLSPAAARLVAEARERGKWAHMGRVNSDRRAFYAAAVGCQSIDGSRNSMHTSTHVPGALRAAAAGRQLMLEVIP
jgi:hypothetical protein